MLAAVNRLTSGSAFAQAVRRGRRASAGSVVVHMDLRPDASSEPPQVGLIVSKQVGNAVTRNVVKRRLRHLARERLSTLPGGAVVVIRAQPGSSSTTQAQLGADLTRALTRILGAGYPR